MQATLLSSRSCSTSSSLLSAVCSAVRKVDLRMIEFAGALMTQAASSLDPKCGKDHNRGKRGSGSAGSRSTQWCLQQMSIDERRADGRLLRTMQGSADVPVGIRPNPERRAAAEAPEGTGLQDRAQSLRSVKDNLCGTSFVHDAQCTPRTTRACCPRDGKM